MAAGTQINNVLITAYGGIAVRMVAGENLVEGELVAVSNSVDGRVVKSAVDEDMPIGLVFEAANTGEDIWIVVAGIGYALPNAADTPARDTVIYSSSTTAGRVSSSATLPAVTLHNREVGHFIEAAAQGVKARAIIHWN